MFDRADPASFPSRSQFATSPRRCLSTTISRSKIFPSLRASWISLLCFFSPLILSSPRLDVVYAGSLTHRGAVAPLSLTTISSQLFITRQGAYDVGGWKLAVSRDGASWIETGKKREVRVKDRRDLATTGLSATLVEVGA